MQAARLHRPVAQRLRNAACRRTVVLVAAQRQESVNGSRTKVLHLMRHGVTEMNEYLARNRWDAEDFVDPMMYDTVLTGRGAAGARAAARAAASLLPQPELLVISPLTRALQTAELAFLSHYRGPVAVEPLARERVWHASDIGSTREDLQRRFPHGRFDFSSLPNVWWHCPGPHRSRDVELEPEGVFKARVAALRRWLAARPESSIALVAHWGLLYELTGGADFANCELRSFSLTVEVETEAGAEEGEGGGDGAGLAAAAAQLGLGLGQDGGADSDGREGLDGLGRIVLRECEREVSAVAAVLS